MMYFRRILAVDKRENEMRAEMRIINIILRMRGKEASPCNNDVN